MTYEQQTLLECPMPTATVSDFRVRLFQLLDAEGGSKIHAALYSLRSCGWRRYENLNIFSLKTSWGCFPMMEEILSAQSSQLWTNAGMMHNGRCLTVRILEYHKTEKECSLSEILEEQVDQKYFLSPEQTAKLLNKLSEEAKDTVSTMRGGVSVTLASQSGGMGAKTGLYMIPCTITTDGLINIGREYNRTLMARDYKGVSREGIGGVIIGNKTGFNSRP